MPAKVSAPLQTVRKPDLQTGGAMLKRRLLILAAAAVVLVSTAFVANPAGGGTAKPAAGKTINTFVTLYGRVDNSPPGNGISGGRIHTPTARDGPIRPPAPNATHGRPGAPGT